ncbi:MAG: carbohydrate kinase family protein [Planctomycetota bacterium]|jgi:fructokinase
MTSERRPLIVGLGEILWDVFPDGVKFGGAPANFASHAAALGGDVRMVSGVGRDKLGDAALRTLAEKHLNTQFIQRQADFPTGAVQISVDGAGHPTYHFGSDEAWDHLQYNDDLETLAREADAVCFGTLGQRGEVSRQTIQQFVTATKPECLRVFDINLRPPFVVEAVIDESLLLANVLKLNDDELPFLAARYGLPGTAIEQMKSLADRFSLPTVVLTRGADGAILLCGDEVSELPGQPISVKDTVGAGDSFTAAVVLGLLRGLPLDTINQHASRVAAFVCSQAGATPQLPENLLSAEET